MMADSGLMAKLTAGRARQHRTAARSMTRLVTFSAGGETFGLDVACVREIVEVRRIRAVPHAPEFLEGVIDVRGHMVPAVDLVKRLGLGQGKAENALRKGVLAEVGDQTVALLVDQVFHVVRVASDEVEPPPPGILRPGAEALVTGIARAGQEVIFVLRLETLFSAIETSALSRAMPGPDESSTHRPRSDSGSAKRYAEQRAKGAMLGGGQASG